MTGLWSSLLIRTLVLWNYWLVCGSWCVLAKGFPKLNSLRGVFWLCFFPTPPPPPPTLSPGGVSLLISWCLHQMSTVHFCWVLLRPGLVRVWGGGGGYSLAAVPAGRSPTGSWLCAGGLALGSPCLVHWHILMQLQRKVRDKYVSCPECRAV